jgi:hypothetical protein
VLGGVIYAYDPSGAPTWVRGFRPQSPRRGDVRLHRHLPLVRVGALVARSVGQVTFDFASETRSSRCAAYRRFATAPGLRMEGAALAQDRTGRRRRASPTGRWCRSLDAARLKAYNRLRARQFPAQRRHRLFPRPGRDRVLH